MNMLSVGSKTARSRIWLDRMQNDLKYQVRSREIVDLVSAMRGSRLTLSPYFQRNLVWRESHKKDFIDTILNGYPFPQIFLARGPINVDTLQANQAVVDGQQRLNAIKDFINGELEVNGKTFKQLTPEKREEFLKYEVAVIDFDLNVGDPRLKDVFHRLNRTYYALSAIEKLASEYSASEFMLVARVMCGEIRKHIEDDSEYDVGNEENEEVISANLFSRDPGIDENIWKWMVEKSEGELVGLINSKPIFTTFEFDRKVPLMFMLNIMCTHLSGYYNRSDRVRKYLELYASDFPEKENTIVVLNRTANYISEMNLDNNSIWWNKANFFTLLVELSKFDKYKLVSPRVLSVVLSNFATNMPKEYGLAAREAVNGRAQRELRGKAVQSLIAEAAGAVPVAAD